MTDEYLGGESALRSASLKGIKTLGAQVESWKREVANPRRRIPYGWPELDELVRGPAAGEVHTLVAHSFVGKSLVATNIMANNPDKRILFFSLEMPTHQVLHRLASHVFNVPADQLEGMIEGQQLPDFIEQLESRLPYQVVVDDSSLGFDAMSAYLSDYSTYFNARPELVIIDYMEEVGGGKQSGEGWVRTEATASAAKAWAKDQKVGVFMLHQSNRGMGMPPEWEPPTRKSARGGGYTEADVFFGMWRPGWDPSLADHLRKSRDKWVGINVLKNRVRGLRHDGLLYRFDPALRLVKDDSWGPRRIAGIDPAPEVPEPWYAE